MKRLLIAGLLMAGVLLFSNGPLYASIMNGDFSSGLDNWTTDDNFGSSSPSASVSTSGGQAVLATQGYESGIFATSIYQNFEVSALASLLNFDIYFERGPEDTNDPGNGLPDFLWASYLDDNDSGLDTNFVGYDNAGTYNVNGSLADLTGGWYRFSTDITGMRNSSGTLYFDLIDDLDGYYSLAKVDNVFITESQEQQTPVPEPSTIIMLGGGVFGLLALRKKRSK